MNGWMDTCMDGWVDVWMNGRMDGCTCMVTTPYSSMHHLCLLIALRAYFDKSLFLKSSPSADALRRFFRQRRRILRRNLLPSPSPPFNITHHQSNAQTSVLDHKRSESDR